MVVGQILVLSDGLLSYRTERVQETYYSILLAKQTTLTLDYQLLLNPAYNADRGPVNVFSVRLHSEL
jgi:high affinity Mn2+ porin